MDRRRDALRFKAALSIACAFALLVPTMSSDVYAGKKNGGKKAVEEAPPPRYTGPQARIAVGNFEVKAQGATAAIGDGLREMLVTALFKSRRFIVLERQAIQDVMLEQDLGASGRVKQETAAPVGELEGAEILVYGVVSEFEADQSGSAIHLRAPGGVPLKLGSKKAHLAIDLRAVDTVSGRILLATRVEGEASKFNAAVAANLGGGRGGMPVGLGSYANTPMEKAIQVAILEAVSQLSTEMPPKYFRHEQ